MSQPKLPLQPYQPRIKRNFGISPLWILPIIALVLAGWLITKAINTSGQRIQIYFSNAQGLIAGRTTIQYQGLEVGIVRDISLSPNLDNIYVDADIYPQATTLLNKNTRFWLVKPTASMSGISGLDALVSGNYIAIQPGEVPKGEDELITKYIAFDDQPTDFNTAQGLNITLHSRDLGSISIGSQIVYKKIPIGEVYSYKLDEEAKNVLIKASIKNEYANIITNKSRFWNVSGAGAQIGFHGIDVQFESLSALLTGAIAVDSPDGGTPVKDNSKFTLYPDLKTAGRGIPIKITLPDGNSIHTSGTPIMYRGLKIGQVTDLMFSEDKEHIIASATIQPAFSDTLNSGSRFLLEEPKLSLTGIKNLSNLVTGDHLTLVPGQGESVRDFKAMRKEALFREKGHSIAIELTSDNSYGLSVGAEVLYRGIVVGSVSDIKLIDKQVIFNVLIKNQYQYLLKSQNRFFVTGNMSAKLTTSGLNVTVPPAKQLLAGAISFISKGKDKNNHSYRLFANESLAELATANRSGTDSFTLIANELPSVSKGSPLLYRNLQVGTIDDYSLTNSGVQIIVKIEKRYKHLITDKTVFWNNSGIEVNANLNGLNIKAAPLKTLIQGGIAFDNMIGVENKQGEYWHLYESLEHARKYGKQITLVTTKNIQFTKGTPVKFQGITVGEVSQLTPDFEEGKSEIGVRIYPAYADKVAKKNSYFWIVSPKIGLNGIENLDTLLSTYIGVKPGTGENKNDFTLHSVPMKEKGVTFVLQSEHKNSVVEGAPVLYRDIEVGQVIKIELGAFADRVISTIEISPQYAYLVRENSIFWNVSGLNVSVGFSGAKIKTGTVDSLVRGGVAFSTPEETHLKPIAAPKHSFILHPQAQEKWLSWRTAIPKPQQNETEQEL